MQSSSFNNFVVYRLKNRVKNADIESKRSASVSEIQRRKFTDTSSKTSSKSDVTMKSAQIGQADNILNSSDIRNTGSSHKIDRKNTNHDPPKTIQKSKFYNKNKNILDVNNTDDSVNNSSIQ